ncbi:amidohydrolase [Pendulispora rubella]|uniref:Amidohydrolase n=1 Tax=Pendulispora rubella TaxID=2741070 RepID=A0ABZ2L817_9BACT
MKRALGLALLLSVACGGSNKPAAVSTSSAGEAAEVALVHGRIFTADPEHPEAQALAISHGRVVAVGSDAEVQPFLGPRTRIIDFQNRRAVPGFRDSHVHFLYGGLGLSRVDLKDAANEAELGRRLVEADRQLPPGRWMLGGNWDHDRALAGRLPDAALLDKYVPHRPVFLARYDGHMALANSRALQLAGIDARTQDPPGGVIYRQSGTRTPSGLLRDNAMDLVLPKVPPLEEEEILEGVRAAAREAHRHGVTAVEDLDGSDPATRARLIDVYRRLGARGELGVRVDLYWPLAEYAEAARVRSRGNFDDDWLRLGGVKGFVDGSIGSSTARLFEPYLNEPNSTGLYVTPPETLRTWIAEADATGLAVAVHAIGDRANAELLSMFENAARINAGRAHRFRIEHAQHLRHADIARFASAGVIASMQPYHAIDDGRWVEGRIGPARAASSYTWRSLLNVHATLAFGSDWPVAPLSALTGIDAAVHRRPLDGKHPEGWYPAERISAREAVLAYTRGAAIAAGHDRDEGSLARGKFADLAVLSRDILDDTAKDGIADTRVVLTIAGGQVVYENR